MIFVMVRLSRVFAMSQTAEKIALAFNTYWLRLLRTLGPIFPGKSTTNALPSSLRAIQLGWAQVYGPCYGHSKSGVGFAARLGSHTLHGW